MAKRQAILEAAQTLFLRQGYEGSSMDAIAAEAGVSKLTVYNHFTDKESLYIAAVNAQCEQQLPELFFNLQPGESVEIALQRIGIAFTELVNSPASIALHRLLLSPGDAHLPLANAFYDIGPLRAAQQLAALLLRLSQAGQLRIDNPLRAAEHCLCMLKGTPHFRLLLGCAGAPTPAQNQQHVAAVVALFVRAYSA